jgi:hypothetical protein
MVMIARDRQTQWAAQFAVASELCKRGYEVSLTMGNATPVADLMLVSPTFMVAKYPTCSRVSPPTTATSDAL